MLHKPFHGVHPCDVCKKEYVSLSDLNEHKLSHSIFRCEKCDKQFNTEVQLKIHTSYHSEVLIECGLCSEKFDDKPSLYAHFKDFHNIFSCQVCHILFQEEESFAAHLESHIINQYTCELCVKTFEVLSDLLKHKATRHKKPKNYSIPQHCPYCDRILSSTSHLKLHLAVHAKPAEGYTQCTVCKMSFNTNKNLKQHMETHASPSTPSFECDICQKKFSRKYYLPKHRRSHFPPRK